MIAATANLHFELAAPSDDARVVRLLDESPMGGAIEVVFARHPSFQLAASTLGDHVQTFVARRGDEVIAFATRAERLTWRGDDTEVTGYLGDLRIRETDRNGLVLARGFQFLRELHAGGEAESYTTVIVEDNELALRSVTSGRAGLPRYTERGRLLTPMIEVHRARRMAARRSAASRTPVRRATEADRTRIVERLNELRDPYALVHDASVITTRHPGLAIEDFLVVEDGDRFSGVLAVWNQSSFRQTRVHRYAPLLRVSRPAVNWWTGGGLPPVGERIDHRFLSFVRADDPDVLSALLDTAILELDQRRCPYALIGLAADDPLSIVLDSLPRIPFAGRVFTVAFEDVVEPSGRPHLEAALL